MITAFFGFCILRLSFLFIYPSVYRIQLCFDFKLLLCIDRTIFIHTIISFINKMKSDQLEFQF
jgi:hypothetical protein